MAINNRGVTVTSDISRQLDQFQFTPSSFSTSKVFRDTVYKHFLLEIYGALQVTYASGTPVSDDTSTLSRLINFIKVEAGGDVTLKNVNPWFLHMQSVFATGQFNKRLCDTGAAAIDPDDLTADAKFLYPTTTEFSSFAEAILISFENVLAGEGRPRTWWDTRGLPSANLQLTTAAYSNLLAFGNTAPATYADNDSVFVKITTIETQNVPQNLGFQTWKQTQKTVSASAAGERREEIVRGNFLQGIMFQVRNGSAGTATTDLGKALSNSALKGIQLIINGTQTLQTTSFQDLQNKNRNRYGLNVPYVNDKSILTGIAYMDLLNPLGGEKYGSLSTAQDLRAPMVDMVEVSLDFNSNGTYAVPATVTMMFNEIIKPAGSNSKS